MPKSANQCCSASHVTFYFDIFKMSSSKFIGLVTKETVDFELLNTNS